MYQNFEYMFPLLQLKKIKMKIGEEISIVYQAWNT